MRSAFALALAWLALSADSLAQDATIEASPAPEAAPEPEARAIPLAEISQRAEQTTLVLDRVDKAASLPANIAEIEEKLPEIEDSLAQRERLLSRALETGGSRGRLVDATAEWNQTRAQIQRWREAFEPRLKELEESLDLLAKEREIWGRSREAAIAEKAPEPIVKRIRTTLSDIDEASERARKAQATLLTLQDRIVEQDLLASEALERISAAQRERRVGLFERDAPRAWGDILGIVPNEHFADVRSSIAEDLRKVRDFAAAIGSRFLLDLLIFIVVYRYAAAVKRRLASPEDDIPPIGSSGELFQRPIAIALLATILLARLVHGPAPIVFTTLVSLGLLVPLIRLVPFLLPTDIRWVVWVLAALIVVSRVRIIVLDAPFASEVLFVMEVVGMIASLLWLMRPKRLEAVPADARIPRFLIAGMRATLVLLCASLVSSALGFRGFGYLIGNATMLSVYAAVILFAAAHAAEAAMEASFHTAPARKLSFVRRRRDAVLRVTGRYASGLAMVYWFYLTLRNFEILDSVTTAVKSVLAASLAVGEIEISLGDVIAFALTIVVSFMLSRLIRFFLEEEALPRMRLRRGVGNAIATLLQYTILLLGFALALSAAGMDFTRVALFAGAFSVGIGFGLQTIANNFVSGLILLFERPIQIGDVVEIGALRGEVRRIGARSSTVRTFDGAEVIVPNANLIAEPVTNWTLSDRRRRLEVPVGVAYGTDPEIVLDLLRGVAAADPSVLEAPEPEALFLEFGDSSLNFRLRVWIPRFEEGFTILSRLSVAINAALRDAGIQIPFPQRDLHLRSVEADVIRSLDDRTKS